jgi:hypothetical protein
LNLRFRRGDRVRIINSNHEYTGCRGTIADAPSDPASGVAQLGHHVAVDGENGLTRPFLVSDLEPLRALRAGRRRSTGASEPLEARPVRD